MTFSPEEMLATLQWRYATKKFDPTRVIPAGTWAVLEASLALTPSSFGLQPWRFLIVKNPEIRRLLTEESWHQSQITEASHLVVFTSRNDLEEKDIQQWIERMAEVRGNLPESLAGYQGVIEGFTTGMSAETRKAWNSRQLYIALGQLMTAAAVLGIDSCPLEGISTAGYDRVLGLEHSGYSTFVACALGYRSADDKYAALPKIRYPKEQVIRVLE